MYKIDAMSDAELMQFLQNMRCLSNRGHYAYSLALHHFASLEAKKRKLV